MTKIDIFSGFLGAGKTTLIKKLISEAYAGEKLVLIENEFGEIGIDGGFLKESGIEITEMNSGCICCSLVGDFGKALEEVISRFSPERIIIEPSGVGKLSDVIKAVRNIDNHNIELNSFTTVVDAKKCKVYMKNFGEFFNNQIENAGCIVLSHTSGISEEKLEDCISLIRSHNESANIISTPWEEIGGTAILDAMENKNSLKAELEKLEEENDICPECGHHHGEHEHNHEHNHHADEVFTSWGIETAAKFTKEQISDILSELENSEKYGMILRAKGIVAGDGEWIHFDYVPNEPDVRTGGADVIGRICVIGSKINESAIAELFGIKGAK